MTDPIEKAADAIIELINSQPRSPNKVEIMDVLRLHHPHRPEDYRVAQAQLDEAIKAANPIYFIPSRTSYTLTPDAQYLFSTAGDLTSWASDGMSGVYTTLDAPQECKHNFRYRSYNILKDEHKATCSACGHTVILQK